MQGGAVEVQLSWLSGVHVAAELLRDAMIAKSKNQLLRTTMEAYRLLQSATEHPCSRLVLAQAESVGLESKVLDGFGFLPSPLVGRWPAKRLPHRAEQEGLGRGEKLALSRAIPLSPGPSPTRGEGRKPKPSNTFDSSQSVARASKVAASGGIAGVFLVEAFITI